jgi:U4/U6.U5 tri-snRNP-associated protein 1
VYLPSKIVVSSTTTVSDGIKTYASWCSRTAEDELQNVEMAEEERRQTNEDLKKKRREYTGYDDEEFAEGNAGMKRAVLAKYDEDIDGSGETVCPVLACKVTCITPAFRASVSVDLHSQRPRPLVKRRTSAPQRSTSHFCPSIMPVRSRGFVFPKSAYGSIENVESSDYLKEGDVGFKKPKVCRTFLP